MKRSFLFHLSLALISLIMLPSCSSDFRKVWKRDICPAPPPANGVAGKWEGTWLSAANGHHGNLRCVVSGPHEEGKFFAKGDHTFFYHATWMKILSGSYKAVHNVQKKSDGYVFKGEHKMPDWAGGLYHYEGTIKRDNFSATYKSSLDHGTFTMKRAH